MTDFEKSNERNTRSQDPVQTSKSFGLVQKVKLAVQSFVVGAVAGAAVGGYVVVNADRFNLSFLPKGNNNAQSTNTSSGNQTGEKSSGNAGMNFGSQAGGGNAGNVGMNNIGGNSGLGDINASGNAKIDIRIEPTNPQFQNDKLPGYFPNEGFEAQPPQLSQFEGAKFFTRDLLIAGHAEFTNRNIVAKGKNYIPIFYLRGSNREINRVAFKLNGNQKGALLQFGVEDLTSGDTNLTYQVDIAADGRKIWTGRVIYGTEQQLLSVPLNIAGATTLTIEHIISQGGNYPQLALVFTRAELLYK